ncbi:VWA domain-containing protein [Euzebya rosea]|uniref:VWA domain-containing protein n=1 Tax=Euzebya rosea TaxID=2052804 RepID=UPI000D3EBDA6|nr:VWA domain-containing protein [Euzebya rosea]
MTPDHTPDQPTPDQPTHDRDTGDPAAQDRLRRWRLVLGSDDGADGTGVDLAGPDIQRDSALEALYGSNTRRQGGLGGSSPRVARWLGDIRTFFPSTVVQVMQRDAMTRLGLADLLVEPEMIDAVQPDLDMVTTLMGLSGAIPDRSKQAARLLVRAVTDDLVARLESTTRQAVSGAISRSTRTRRPRHGDIDWPATIAANLAHYQPEYRTVIPHRLVGHARRRSHIDRRIVLCLDQSGSMADSIVYASVFGAILASLPAVDVRLVVFDTTVVDLTDRVEDPVDVLFGVQLGGGTDINAALAYCQQLIDQPSDTVFVLVSDLHEGGVRTEMLRRFGQLVTSGVTAIALLALSDIGTPSWDADNAAALAELGVPAFACTPELFADMMAAAINRDDVGRWAGDNDIAVAQPTD